MKNKLIMWFMKKYLIQGGPFMFRHRDYWIFIDHYSRLWKIQYTGGYENPIIINLEQK